MRDRDYDVFFADQVFDRQVGMIDNDLGTPGIGKLFLDFLEFAPDFLLESIVPVQNIQ